MLGLCGSSSVYRYALDTCRWMAYTRAARAATSRVQWTKKGQKFAKNLPAFFSLFWLLIIFMFCFLSQRTWLDLIQFGHGTRFYYCCTNRLSYFILNTFVVTFRCWVFNNATLAYLCVSPQKDCESRTRTIAVMRSITATRHVAQAAYRKLSIFRKFRCATSLFTSYDICMTAGSQGRPNLKKSEGLKTIYYT